ncbi:MAG TPA: ADP-ribosylglycohydrolase family protein, partial [Spirochaetes bacterium]|nr:ADP-ribosylglycohydrolase family protein [Spirochaetota bacterium]
SDDGSLLLSTVESLFEGFDLILVMKYFLMWLKGNWWAHNKVFDIGGTTMAAMDRIASGVDPVKAGGVGERDNGNGSLMRILPVALRYHNESIEVIIDRAHRASAITHAHPVSKIACGLYCAVAALILNGMTFYESLRGISEIAAGAYGSAPWNKELTRFRRILGGELARLPEDEIRSTGYVVDTLEASLWCLLGTGSFSEAVLKAVNLGDDADTTGCVTGGLAGLIYGYGAIPPEWIEALSGKGDIDDLIDKFIAAKNRQPIVPAHEEIIGDGLMLDD